VGRQFENLVTARNRLLIVADRLALILTLLVLAFGSPDALVVFSGVRWRSPAGTGACHGQMLFDHCRYRLHRLPRRGAQWRRVASFVVAAPYWMAEVELALIDGCARRLRLDSPTALVSGFVPMAFATDRGGGPAAAGNGRHGGILSSTVAHAHAADTSASARTSPR
jgi:Cu/Ag efflux pump CusA